MDDLGEYRCCVWSLRDLEGIWEEGVVHSRRGNQTLIHFGGDSWSMIFFFLRERKKVFKLHREADLESLAAVATSCVLCKSNKFTGNNSIYNDALRSFLFQDRGCR